MGMSTREEKSTPEEKRELKLPEEKLWVQRRGQTNGRVRAEPMIVSRLQGDYVLPLISPDKWGNDHNITGFHHIAKAQMARDSP